MARFSIISQRKEPRKNVKNINETKNLNVCKNVTFDMKEIIKMVKIGKN